MNGIWIATATTTAPQYQPCSLSFHVALNAKRGLDSRQLYFHKDVFAIVALIVSKTNAAIAKRRL